MSAISASAASDGAGKEYAVITENGVRFRTSPSTSSELNTLCLLNTGDMVEITGSATGSGYTWAKGIITQGPSAFIGCTGYVAAGYFYIWQQ